jgi:sialate O-acetylesterase
MKLVLKSALVLVFCFAFIVVVKANISMPEIFASNMVLQQKSDVKIWGWAKPGEPVKLKADWQDSEIETKADNQGTWSLQLKTPEAGGPFTLRIKGFNEIVFENVLIGEVWLCSGQSNMEWSPNA